MPDNTLLTDLLSTGAMRDTGITYVIGENKDKFISYRELQQRALALLGYFQSVNIAPGNEMILLVNRNEHFIDAFWACIYGGIVPVPLSTGISDNHSEKILRVFKKLKNPVVYTTKDELSRFEDFLTKQGYTTEIEEVRNSSVIIEEIGGSFEKGIPHVSEPTDLAFIQFSSGSTGAPKGVMLSHENLLFNIQAIIIGSEFESTDRTFGWMPLTHDLGLIGFHLVPLAAGSNQMLMATELFVRRPMLWMQKSAEHKVTVTCSPNFGYKHFLKYINQDILNGLNLQSIRLVLNGAEPISASLCREFTERLSEFGLNTNSMFPVYGLAEASLAVSFPTPGDPLQTVTINRKALSITEKIRFSEDTEGLELVKVGTPVKFCNLKIVDGHGNGLPELTIGKLKINGKNVSQGYYEDMDTTNSIIENGWLDTGDMGFIHEGSLVITGRSKDVIFLNGQNLYPHDLEHILEQTDELEIGKTAITGVIDAQKMLEEPAVFVSFRGNPEEFIPLTKVIKGHLSAFIGLEVEKILPVHSIPKTTSGKVQRYLLAEQYHNGEFDDIEKKIKKLQSASKGGPEHSSNEIEITLLDICKEFISQDIRADDNLFELGTSSLVLTQIHDRIDALWPNKLELTDYFDYPTITELAIYLKQQD